MKWFIYFAKSKLKPQMKEKYLHFTYNTIASKIFVKGIREGQQWGQTIHVNLCLIQISLKQQCACFRTVWWDTLKVQALGLSALQRVLSVKSWLCMWHWHKFLNKQSIYFKSKFSLVLLFSRLAYLAILYSTKPINTWEYFLRSMQQ